MTETCEGLPGPLDDRAFLDGSIGTWRAATTTGVVGPPGTIWSSAAASSARALGPEVRGRPEMTLLGPIAALTGAEPWVAAGADATAAAARPLRPFDAQERPIPGFDLPTGPLHVADAWVLPVEHWVQLLWANLLALGPFLWQRLVGHGPPGVARLAWGALRARSVSPENVAARLNRVADSARIHRSAVVEGCVLGAGARVGAGAVVRGSILGEGAVVEELALVDGAVLGAHARVQRLAMAKFSVLEADACFAGIMQLGVLGRGATVKHGATLMDMTLGQGVRVRVGDTLRPAPHTWCGVCVGPGAVVASGVRVAPGRVIPAGVEILLDPTAILTHTDVPDGVTRAFVRHGRLEPA